METPQKQRFLPSSRSCWTPWRGQGPLRTGRRPSSATPTGEKVRERRGGETVKAYTSVSRQLPCTFLSCFKGRRVAGLCRDEPPGPWDLDWGGGSPGCVYRAEGVKDGEAEFSCVVTCSMTVSHGPQTQGPWVGCLSPVFLAQSRSLKYTLDESLGEKKRA